MTYNKHIFRQLRRTIGANIHSRRAERRIPLRKLSRLTGIPRELLDQYELGKDKPSLESLLRISCALDIDLASLIINSPKTTQFDSADYLDSDEAIDAYREPAIEANDPAFGTIMRVAQALGLKLTISTRRAS